MATYWYWLILCVVLVSVEMLTGTVYLLMLALGMGAGAVFAWLGLDIGLQILAAAIVAGLGCWAVRRFKMGQAPAPSTQRDANVHLDVGNVVMVESWQGRHATVNYRGAQWQADLDEHLGTDAAKTGLCTVVAVHGNRLMLKPNEL